MGLVTHLVGHWTRTSVSALCRHWTWSAETPLHLQCCSASHGAPGCTGHPLGKPLLHGYCTTRREVPMTRSRRTWGSVHKLPSQRFQAIYAGPDLARYRAPHTFASRLDAEAWLMRVRDAITNGAWTATQAPELSLIH